MTAKYSVLGAHTTCSGRSSSPQPSIKQLCPRASWISGLSPILRFQFLLGVLPWHHRAPGIVLLAPKVFHCLKVSMQDVAIDPPIPALLLRADLALPGQPADVFRMKARKLCCLLGGDPVWQEFYPQSQTWQWKLVLGDGISASSTRQNPLTAFQVTYFATQCPNASSWKTPVLSVPIPRSARKLAIMLPSIAATPLRAISRQLLEEILPVVKNK
jgi:hypothetical protein